MKFIIDNISELNNNNNNNNNINKFHIILKLESKFLNNYYFYKIIYKIK